MAEVENQTALRVLVVLDGDIAQDPEMHIKYNTFLKALDRRISVVGVCNVKLRGFQRLWTAVMVWHPNIRIWRERALKNVLAFVFRSRKAANWIRSMQEQADVVVQLGVLFNAGWDGIRLPIIIYTDYTAQLSARRKDAGRSPLRGAEFLRWLELERQAMKRAENVCVRSQLVYKSIVEDYKIPSEQVSIIGGGVNLEHLPNPAALSQNRNPTILFIGLDFYRKGGDLVLNAFSKALLSVSNAQLLFVTKKVISDGIPIKSVKIIPPIWNREEFIQLYDQADIFVLASRLETWGDVLLEAMAYGLPCIGVKGQSMEEIIRHRETGILVPPEDVNALAAAFIELLKDEELRHQMGQAGYRLVANEFLWDHVADRLVPLINNAVERFHK